MEWRGRYMELQDRLKLWHLSDRELALLTFAS